MSGVYIFNSGEMDITNSLVSGNVSGGNGPQFPFGNGGGISNQPLAGSLYVTNCTIRDNSTGLYGGGIYNIDYGGPFAGKLTITNSTIANNQAGQGGGIANDGTLWHPHITDKVTKSDDKVVERYQPNWVCGCLLCSVAVIVGGGSIWNAPTSHDGPTAGAPRWSSCWHSGSRSSPPFATSLLSPATAFTSAST